LAKTFTLRAGNVPWFRDFERAREISKYYRGVLLWPTPWPKHTRGVHLPYDFTELRIVRRWSRVVWTAAKNEALPGRLPEKIQFRRFDNGVKISPGKRRVFRPKTSRVRLLDGARETRNYIPSRDYTECVADNNLVFRRIARSPRHVPRSNQTHPRCIRICIPRTR